MCMKNEEIKNYREFGLSNWGLLRIMPVAGGGCNATCLSFLCSLAKYFFCDLHDTRGIRANVHCAGFFRHTCVQCKWFCIL